MFGQGFDASLYRIRDVEKLLIQAGAIVVGTVDWASRKSEVFRNSVILLAAGGRRLEEIIQRSTVTHSRKVDVFP